MKRNKMGLMRVGDDGAMFYQAPSGTKYRLGKGEPIGRIHSLNIGLPKPTIKVMKRSFTTTHTKMRCRTRNTRPATAHARKRGGGSHVTTGGLGNTGTGSLSLSENFCAKLVIHIVRPHLDDDVIETGKKEKGRISSFVSEEYIQEDVFAEQESEPQYLKPTRRLRPPSQGGAPKSPKERGLRPPSQGDGPTGKLSEFEEIMRRRKNKVDTMDNTGRLMKSLSSQSDLNQRRSQYWNLVRDCLKDKSYMNFAYKRMGSFAS